MLLLLFTILNTSASGDTIWFTGEIHFKGNRHVDMKELLDRMETRPGPFWKKTPFSFSQLVADCGAIRSLYREKGFLRATADIDSLQRDSLSHTINVVIAINEGPLTTVNTVRVSGSRTFSDSLLLTKIPLKTGSPCDSSLIYKSRLIIGRLLASKGHLFGNVSGNYTVDSAESRATVGFTVHDGPLVRAGALEIPGVQSVKEIVVRRELDFREGDILTFDKLDTSIKKIYSTGLFEFVYIEPQDTSINPDDSVEIAPILVELRERTMIIYNAGGGYNSYEKWFVSGEAGYRNLFRLGHRIQAAVEFSTLVKDGSLSYLYPWFLSLPVNVRFMGYGNMSDQTIYSGTFEGLYFELNRNPGSPFFYRGWSRIEHVSRFSQIPSLPEFPSVPIRQTYLLGAGAGLDFRTAETQFGNAAMVYGQAELAGLGFPNSYSFFASRIDLRYYTPVFFNLVRAGTALQVSHIAGYGKDKGIVALQERLRSGFGGIRPVRGYSPQRLEPHDREGRARGGTLSLVLNAFEVRIPVYKTVETALFMDAGNIWNRPGEFSLNDLKWAAGPGLRVRLPIGLVRLDYAFRIDRDKDVEGNFSFGLGLPF